MNVFISWSGARSRAVGEVLKKWIKSVLQATQPWMSTSDIERGALWGKEINDRIKDSAVGIVCLTQENKNAPWILFESGALAKGLEKNHVCTFLIDLKPADIEGPLAQFNHTSPDRDGIWRLVQTLNTCIDGGRLEKTELEDAFTTWWPKFEEKFQAAIKANPHIETPEVRSDSSMLAEIVESTRSVQQTLVSYVIDQYAAVPRSFRSLSLDEQYATLRYINTLKQKCQQNANKAPENNQESPGSLDFTGM